MTPRTIRYPPGAGCRRRCHVKFFLALQGTREHHRDRSRAARRLGGVVQFSVCVGGSFGLSCTFSPAGVRHLAIRPRPAPRPPPRRSRPRRLSSAWSSGSSVWSSSSGRTRPTAALTNCTARRRDLERDVLVVDLLDDADHATRGDHLGARLERGDRVGLPLALLALGAAHEPDHPDDQDQREQEREARSPGGGHRCGDQYHRDSTFLRRSGARVRHGHATSRTRAAATPRRPGAAAVPGKFAHHRRSTPINPTIPIVVRPWRVARSRLEWTRSVGFEEGVGEGCRPSGR